MWLETGKSIYSIIDQTVCVSRKHGSVGGKTQASDVGRLVIHTRNYRNTGIVLKKQ